MDISICYDMDIRAFIEITEPSAFNFECKQVATLVETYEIEEGFVFDRKRNTWRKFKLGNGEIIDNPSFCDSIGYDLNDFLK